MFDLTLLLDPVFWIIIAFLILALRWGNYIHDPKRKSRKNCDKTWRL